jgi:hypothetical protein
MERRPQKSAVNVLKGGGMGVLLGIGSFAERQQDSEQEVEHKRKFGARLLTTSLGVLRFDWANR